MSQQISETPTVINLTLTSANAEYSQLIPSGTRGVRVQCRTAYAVRFAYEAGKVATSTNPYLTLPSGANYGVDDIDLTGKTLYFASSQAGVVVEIEIWGQ